MKNGIYSCIVILTIGFFLLSGMAYACGNKSEKLCCKKEITSKSENKDCFKNKHSKGKSKSCDGKCGHSNCTTSSVTFSIISQNEIQFKNNSSDFSEEKSKFYHSETVISSGFTSVWLPPKI